MIEVTRLSKFYGNVKAVNDISFEVDKGEIVGLLGPNGAGKTTTMRVLTTFIPATKGTVKVAGYDVFEDSMQVRKRVGYLPEHPPLYYDMTVAGYLDFVADIKEVKRKEKKKRISEVMDMVSIKDIRKRLIANISKGYRQRVGLAQALIHDPEVLILDEPTVGLDPKQIREIRSLIKGLARERTIILSTHILPEASATCDRVMIINEGRIVAIDTHEDLVRRVRGADRLYLEIKGPRENIANSLKEIDGVRQIEHVEKKTGDRWVFEIDTKPDQDIREDVFNCAASGGWPIYEMRTVGMSLEDVFLKLTTKEEGVSES